MTDPTDPVARRTPAHEYCHCGQVNTPGHDCYPAARDNAPRFPEAVVPALQAPEIDLLIARNTANALDLLQRAMHRPAEPTPYRDIHGNPITAPTGRSEP